MDTTPFKAKLEKEREQLEQELNRIAIQDPNNPEAWVLKTATLDVLEADENERADRTEETHIDSIVLDELDARYRLVLHALRKFEAGTYGICEVSGTPIEEARLEANPAARTCKAHVSDLDERAL